MIFVVVILIVGYGNIRKVLSDGRIQEKSKSHMEVYKMSKTFNSEKVDVMFTRAAKEEVKGIMRR